MKDSVGKWYKDRAEELNVIPPHEAWENVESTMQDWPRHWYQSNFSGMESETGKQSWEAISEQLEIQRNVKKSRRMFYIRTASLVAGLALIPMWIANVSNLATITTPNMNVPTAVANNNEVVAPSSPVAVNVAVPTIQTVQNTATTPSTTATPEIIDITTNTTPQINPVLAANAVAMIEMNAMETQETMPLREALPVLAGLTRRAVPTFNFTEPLDLQDEDVAEETPRNWYVGPTAILGSSELLNPLSFREDATTSNDLNLAWGLTASRRFGKNVLTADVLFNDTKSQMASLNSEEVTTSLNYVTTALQYERVIPLFKSANKLKPELNIGAGIFGSVLSNSTILSNQENSYYSSFTYRNFDAGGVLTAGGSVQLGQHLRAGVNARIQSGVVNLFEGREKVPSKLFRTQSLASGIQAKLSYNF
ncbi:MAG: hypothetical protein NXI10_09715 [bacterium]|nr:hypothetical protein [bacterium]